MDFDDSCQEISFFFHIEVLSYKNYQISIEIHENRHDLDGHVIFGWSIKIVYPGPCARRNSTRIMLLRILVHC